VQRYATLTRHVYSPHIDVASLSWWKKLEPNMQAAIKKAMQEAAVYQRAFNRKHDAARLALLKAKGMQVITDCDIESFRQKVAGLKEMDLFGAPEVKSLLQKIMAATR